MLLKRILNNKKLLILVFIFLFLLTRLPKLGVDVVNPDGVNWHYRSEQFMVGLKTGQFEKTYQHYHPGVTLSWITGVTIELVKQLSGQTIYTHENFLTFHTAAKIMLVIVQLILIAITFTLLHQVFRNLNDKRAFLKAFFVITLLSFEPFIIGNSRLLHMDILLMLFLFISLLLVYLFTQKQNLGYLVLAGLSFSLAFLTKSVGLGGILYSLLFLVFSLYKKVDSKFIVKYLLLLVLFFVLFTFLLFPALWVEPVKVLLDIFNESERIGVRKGHDQIFFGKLTSDPGFFFYFFVILMKLSPVTLFGILLTKYFSFKKRAC